MKKSGIYNSELAKAVSKMGHGDIILIGDVGCPFPLRRPGGVRRCSQGSGRGKSRAERAGSGKLYRHR